MCAIDCVLVGLDWAEPMIQFLLHVTCSCISHAYVLYFSIYLLYLNCFGAFPIVSFFPLSILFTLVVSMTPKRKSTLEDDDDGDASSTDEMSTWHFYPLSLVTKRESSFDMRVVILRGRVSIGLFVRGSVDMRDVVSITCIFSSFYRYIVLVH